MTQYIDKDALVAEIGSLWKHYLDAQEFDFGWNQALDKVSSYLSTHEVKEVDLEKEIDDFVYTYNGRQRLALELDWKQYQVKFDGKKLMDFAKHFFELGIKAQKGGAE